MAGSAKRRIAKNGSILDLNHSARGRGKHYGQQDVASDDGGDNPSRMRVFPELGQVNSPARVYRVSVEPSTSLSIENHALPGTQLELAVSNRDLHVDSDDGGFRVRD